MVVCKFYQSGNCKNGDRCRFEHPGANMNRFAPLQIAGNARDGKSLDGNTSAVPGFAGIDKDNLVKDLSTERPQWILSCYGPGRNAPEQLFGGPIREQSFEEMRLLHYTSPNPQQAAQEFQALVSESDRQMQVALNDLDGAIKFLVDAQHKHPNRNDIITSILSTGKVPDPVNPLLNTTSPPSNGAFGVPQNNNSFAPASSSSNAFGGGGAFGKPAFGAPSAPASTGAFGQPSLLGAKPNPFAAGGSSAFGQPSVVGGGGAFGQPSALGGGGGAFGQPSALGPKPNPFAATTTAPFGQTPAATTTAPSGFSAFANGGSNGFPTANSANPFVQNQTSAFGQPPTGPSSTNGNAFGKPSTFGQPSPLAAPTGPASNANPFSKAGGAFGQPAQPASNQISQQPTFGQPTQPAFGQPSGGFGQPSGGFGQPSGAFGQPSGTFGQPSQPQNPLTNGNAFGAASNPFSNNQPPSQPSRPSQPQFQNQTQPQSQNQQQAQQSRPSASTPGSNNPYGPNATHTHPPLTSYTTRTASNQLTMFKGHQVRFNPTIQKYEFQNRDGSIGKVMFPDGPPVYYPVTEDREEVYAGEGGDQLRRVYENVRDNSGVEFEGGVMPLVAPMREWCLWDF